MPYILDTNSFRVTANYYPQTFPSFWEQLNALVLAGRVISVREVSKELELQNVAPHVDAWVEANMDAVFSAPSEDEMRAVARILAVPHFQQLIGERQRLRGQPVADPWIVARGLCLPGSCVVTEEAMRPNAAKVPNVCAQFGVECITLEAMLAREGWRY